MFAIVTSKKGNMVSMPPNVCIKIPPPPAVPFPIPLPIKGSGSDLDKGKAPKKSKIKGGKIGTPKAVVKKTSPANPAGKPPDKRGVINSKDEGKAEPITVIMKSVTFEGQNPWHATCPLGMDAASPPDTAGMTASGESTATVGVPLPAVDYETLRKKSPTQELRDMVNEGDDPCPACGGATSKKEADHIVPLKKICDMPGMASLTPAQQLQVANFAGNFMGLCKSCNSSKRDREWSTWAGHSTKGFAPGAQAAGQAAAQSAQTALQNLINTLGAVI